MSWPDCQMFIFVALLQRGQALLGGVYKEEVETFGIELN